MIYYYYDDKKDIIFVLVETVLHSIVHFESCSYLLSDLGGRNYLCNKVCLGSEKIF